MFSLIWRFFPGPAVIKILVMLVVLAALVYALITYVYPWASMIIPVPESTVEVP